MPYLTPGHRALTVGKGDFGGKVVASAEKKEYMEEGDVMKRTESEAGDSEAKVTAHADNNIEPTQVTRMPHRRLSGAEGLRSRQPFRRLNSRGLLSSRGEPAIGQPICRQGAWRFLEPAIE